MANGLKKVQYKSDIIPPTEFDTVYYAEKDDVVAYMKVAFAIAVLNGGTTMRITRPFVADGLVGESVWDESRGDWDCSTEHAIHLSNIQSLILPDETILSDLDELFNDCSSLEFIQLPSSISEIGKSMFYNCSSLTSIIIPDSVEKINSYAFNGCISLSSVTIENSVKSIGACTFAFCSSLTSITIPNSVKSIGKDAFKGCSGLTSVTIPDSVMSIGRDAFDGTKWYDNQPDGVVYAGKVLYVYKGTMPSNTKINIKEGTTGITPSAFYGCSGLTSVTIPNSVTSIGRNAFYKCTNLTAIYYNGSSEGFPWGASNATLNP